LRKNFNSSLIRVLDVMMVSSIGKIEMINDKFEMINSKWVENIAVV